MTLLGPARGALLVLFGTSLIGVAPARASDTRDGTLWLDLPDCATSPYEPEALLHALDVELGPERLRAQLQGSGRADSGPRVVLRVSSCDVQADSLTLQIWSSEGRFLGARSLELQQIEPAARARTVALMISDALRPARLPESAAPSAENDLESNPFGAREAPAGAARSWPPVHDDALLETEDPYPRAPGLRIGAAVQARLLARDSSLLLGFELSARGRLFGATEWAVEGSYAEGDSWTPLRNLDLGWWNGAVGIDLIAGEKPRFSIGPRLAIAQVVGTSFEDFPNAEPGTEQRALVMTLGARANLSAPLWRTVSLSGTLDASHSLYERSLTEQGIYLPWYGLAVTWGVGVSIGL